MEVFLTSLACLASESVLTVTVHSISHSLALSAISTAIQLALVHYKHPTAKRTKTPWTLYDQRNQQSVLILSEVLGTLAWLTRDTKVTVVASGCHSLVTLSNFQEVGSIPYD